MNEGNKLAELTELTKKVIAQAQKMGATAVQAKASITSGFTVNVRRGVVDTLEQSSAKSLTVKLYFTHRTGSATTSDYSPEAINNMLAKACYIARFTEEDPNVGLAAKELMAYDYPDLKLYHPWDIGIEDAIKLANNCESAAFKCSSKITNSEGATVNTTTRLSSYANSHDFCGELAATHHSISCTLIAADKQEMQRDYYYTVARHAHELETYEAVATKAAEKTLTRLGARRITTRRCPVVFAPEVATSLINNLIQAIDGKALYSRASFLLGHLGHDVFSKNISIIEDPYILGALGSAPFDDEGVKLHKSNIVTNGVLQRYVLDSYEARKLNLETTGNAGGVHNIIVTPGNLDLSGLLKKMGQGLLVTEFLGGEANIVTGDYSRGAFGYWVENGTIQYPVIGATVAGNLKNMFLGIEEVGNDIDYRSNILTGSILIDGMMVAGD
jgi:PmbA protein